MNLFAERFLPLIEKSGKTDQELEKAMAEAVADRKTPSVINCIIDSDDFVLPMVPAGKSISDPILNIENK